MAEGKPRPFWGLHSASNAISLEGGGRDHESVIVNGNQLAALNHHTSLSSSGADFGGQANERRNDCPDVLPSAIMRGSLVGPVGQRSIIS